MASGKSTVGKALATWLDMDFVDTDLLIEKEQKKSISDIFEQEGEDAFRTYENELLKSARFQNTIIATGGGMPCFNDNIKLLNQLGKTFYLEVLPETILKRLSTKEQTDKRPLLQSKSDRLNFIKAMITKRELFYKQALFIINGELAIDEICERIIPFN